MGRHPKGASPVLEGVRRQMRGAVGLEPGVEFGAGSPGRWESEANECLGCRGWQELGVCLPDGGGTVQQWDRVVGTVHR